MSNWKDDVVEQICISHVLLTSKIETAERLAMIIVDNAVEYTLKAYVELEIRSVGKKIKKKDWEETKKYFESLVNYVYSIVNITADKSKILEYHDLRNHLYHEGIPLSVKPSKIEAYIQQYRILLKDLVGIQLTSGTWERKTKEVENRLIKKVTAYGKILIKYNNESDLPKFISNDDVKDTDALMLALDCHVVSKGIAPSIDELENILARSRHRLDTKTICKRLSYLRDKKLVYKDTDILQPEANRKLRDKFLIDE